MTATHGRIAAATDFRPSPWLPGPHLPTVVASACRPQPRPRLAFERLELPDGDFLDLAWSGAGDGPVVLVLHGLEGGHQSSYARAILAVLATAGYRGVLMHFRGCSGVPNRLPRSYHSGDTGDLATVVATLTRRGLTPRAAIGYSLGGNVLLKWLGEQGPVCPLETAVAVSVPFDLGACARRLEQGASRLYQWLLVGSLKRKYLAKFATRASPLGLPAASVARLRTFWTFDDAVTAPLHGFRDATDYYTRSSSRQFLAGIALPTLILHAADDPFVPAAAIPQARELARDVTLELARRGGHVGFVSARRPPQRPWWLERRILAHLDERLGGATVPAGYNGPPPED